MTVDERDRLDLHQRLEATLGAQAAGTMMELLPPVSGWDVATKADLDAIGARIDARFEAIDGRFEAIDGRFGGLEHRFTGLEHRIEGLQFHLSGSLQTGLAELRTEMAAQTRTVVYVLLAALVSFGGLVLAAVQLG
jgi:hypothetical protein